jgi:2-polyprenyl-3-methyl-5-hydroxy-6-metoxy-1,4-benzoquinol methylase
MKMKCHICASEQSNFFLKQESYNLFKCELCSLIYVDPMPSNDELNDFYNHYHKTKQYSDKSASKVRRAKKRIKTIARFASNKTLLDVGCNIGAGAEAGRLIGFDTLGIDIDDDAIKKAKIIFNKNEFECISLKDLNLRGRKYGIVYCSEVIEHLPELKNFMKSLYDALDKNGILYITTPDIGHFSLRNSIEKIKEWDSVRPPEHLMYLNKKSLNMLLLNTGFTKVKFQFSFKPGIKVAAYK